MALISCKKENNPPITLKAGFTFDNNLISEGDSVKFSDGSQGPVIQWAWNFNGGAPSPSALQNPEVYFSNSGIYSVSLEVINGSVSDTLTKENAITVLPARNLISFYPFDGNANDIIGGKNGTVIRATLSAGIDGTDMSAYHFTSGSIIDISQMTLNLNSDYSIAYWVYVDSLNSPDIYQNTVTCRHDPVTGEEAGGFEMVIDTTGLVSCNYFRSSPIGLIIQINSNGHLTAGAWHFISLVRSGNQLMLYIDNSLDLSESISGLVFSNNSAWSLGGSHNPGVINRNLLGDIDQVRFYQRSLDAVEIGLLFDNHK